MKKYRPMTDGELAKTNDAIKRAKDYAAFKPTILDVFPKKLREYLFDAFGPLDYVTVDSDPPNVAVRFTTIEPDENGLHMQGQINF